MSAGGLDYAAGAAGLVSLSLTIFRGCIQAFEIIQSAANVGREADNFRCKLEVEQYKLIQWAQRIGLEDNPSHQLNWNLITEILKQLETLLSDTQNIRRRYHLELVQLGSGALAQQPDTTRVSSSTYTGFGKLLSKLRPEFRHASSRIIQESNGTVKKLRWAVFDKVKAAKLIEDIIYFNHCLHVHLDSLNQDFVKTALGSVLRDIISHSNATPELEVIKQLLGSTSVAAPEAVASAATLKQIRLVLKLGPDINSIGEVAQRAPPGNLKLKLRHLKPALLQREHSNGPSTGRELARYKSNPVLIEWKTIDRELEKELKTRIDQIAILLAHTDDPSFHSLNCIGIMPKDSVHGPADDASICYGLVFEMAFPVALPEPSSPQIQPISTLYGDARKPSLNERRDIALALAETVLQLHTAGWLHKGIRSENVLFIGAGKNKWRKGSAFGPYLAGYEYSRPSTAQTEETPALPEQEIYLHPRGQGLARDNFRRSFDLFALGCVLLEIGLWSKLEDILRQVASKLRQPQDPSSHQEKSTDKSKALEKVDWFRLGFAKLHLLQNADLGERSELANIAFHAGEAFQKAVLLCLYANDDDPNDEDLCVQKEVVDLLRQTSF
ncbi:MAG: hypothetical protein LQ346_001163 [Caloplaca aetnensis]|nr:MAG: hypothetical protein LQ346_001163 [Caloplaca aetnensis]